MRSRHAPIQEIRDQFSNFLIIGTWRPARGPEAMARVLDDDEFHGHAGPFLSWDGDGYRVQETADLTPPAVWNTVATSPIGIGGLYFLDLPFLGDVRFFRLVQDPQVTGCARSHCRSSCRRDADLVAPLSGSETGLDFDN